MPPTQSRKREVGEGGIRLYVHPLSLFLPYSIGPPVFRARSWSRNLALTRRPSPRAGSSNLEGVYDCGCGEADASPGSRLAAKEDGPQNPKKKKKVAKDDGRKRDPETGEEMIGG